MASARPLLRYSDLPLIRTGTAPVFEFLPDGILHAVRNQGCLLNLVLGCPVGGSMHRIALSWKEAEAPEDKRQGMLIAGPGSGALFSADDRSARWEADRAELRATATLQPFEGGWSVEVTVTNRTSRPVEVQAVHGLDLSLNNQFGARLNESYASQYVDHREIPDPRFLRAIASKQNLAVDGKLPWVIQTWLEGTDGFVTDTAQFFGRFGERDSLPFTLLSPPCPGRVLQSESSYVALFSTPLILAPGESGSRRLLAVFRDDHPEPSSLADLQLLHEAAGDLSPPTAPEGKKAAAPSAASTMHGEEPSLDLLREWFPGDWQAVEHAGERIASFFHGPEHHHVVTFAKEAATDRPTAMILRSGASLNPTDDFLGTTCYMAGVFQSLLSVGHPGFHRLLSPVRERLNLLTASGQRIGIEDDSGVRWLGIPSAFRMSLTSCEWIYQLRDHRIRVRVVVSSEGPESVTSLTIDEGHPLRFIVSHGLVGGEREGEADASTIIALPVSTVKAGPESLARQHHPDAEFSIEAIEPGLLECVGGSELLGFKHPSTTHLVFKTKETSAFSIRLSGRTHESTHLSPSQPAWSSLALGLRVGGVDLPEVRALDAILPWFVHNGMIHFSNPHGIEQWNGGAWGVRDVTQGAVELLLTLDQPDTVKRTLVSVFEHQFQGSGDWPQWFMLDPFGWIQQRHMHGDVPLWPLKALCDYLEHTSDFAFLHEPIDWTDANSARLVGKPSPLIDHVAAAIAWMRHQCFPGTSLLRYGEGDWDDSLQPARPELREHMVSTWTVALAYQVMRRLEDLQRHSGVSIPGLDGFADSLHADFHRWLLPDGIASGFFVFDQDGKSGHPLLHPQDHETGIHYRLLPMKRAIIAGLFSPEQAARHLEIIREHLLAADGARLMDRPAPYRGGPRKIFERAESSAAFAREIGVFYTHAHLRYLEMLSVLGEKDALWHGLQQANPIGIDRSVPNALPRQANVYFSSSDAAVHDRYEAAERYPEIVSGQIPVAGGWRLYSSGPGIFCHLVRTRLLGLRKHYDQVIFDPVLPDLAEGLEAVLSWEGKPLKVIYRRGSPSAHLDGARLGTSPVTSNPYREGGIFTSADVFSSLLKEEENVLEIGF